MTNFTDFDGRTLVVSKRGNDALAMQQFSGNADGSRAYSAHCHFLTVQAAINFAQGGDNINVHAGDYTAEGTLIVKDLVDITADANVVLGGFEGTDVRMKVHGEPRIIGTRAFRTFGNCEIEIQFGLVITELSALVIGGAATDVVSFSGWTGDVVAGNNNIFATDGDLNIDLTQDDIFVDTNGVRLGGSTVDPLNKISFDWQARDVIGRAVLLLNNGNSATEARMQLRDVIATALTADSAASNKVAWINSCRDDVSPGYINRIDVHFRDMIANSADAAQTVCLRVQSGVNEDVNGGNYFFYGSRIVYNGIFDNQNDDQGAAVVWSKGGGNGGESYCTLDVREILGRNAAAIKSVQSQDDALRVGMLRVVNSNISNTNTDINPIRMNNTVGSRMHISFEGCAIYTPDVTHISAASRPDAVVYHKTQTLVNKPDQGQINPVTHFDGNSTNANIVDSCRTSLGQAINGETPFTTIPDALLLEAVNV